MTFDQETPTQQKKATSPFPQICLVVWAAARHAPRWACPEAAARSHALPINKSDQNKRVSRPGRTLPDTNRDLSGFG